MKKKVSSSEFAKMTRSVFDKHHREQSDDEALFSRLTSLISADYFQVPEDWFKNKTILDMGCGSNANASYAFLSLGAKCVYSADIGDQWMDCANKRLRQFGDRSILQSEDVLNLSFDNNRFDFVHCAGVLHHTADPEKGFRELARVTMVTGQQFISIMGTGKGLIYVCVNHLRDLYKKDAEFRKTIDNMNVDSLTHNVEWILDEKEKYEGCTSEEKDYFRGMFDNDLILTIKDRLQAPTYHRFDFSEAQIRGWYEREGYKNIRRITRYTKYFKNMRKYFVPMYYHYDHPLSRLLFGEGYIQMIGTKWR